MGNAAAENRRVRQAITEAVFRLMKEKSYSDISVSDIVKEAQVARASFYRNFESKDAVISDVLQELHNEITSRVSQGFADRLLSRDAFVEHLESTLARILTKKATSWPSTATALAAACRPLPIFTLRSWQETCSIIPQTSMCSTASPAPE